MNPTIRNAIAIVIGLLVGGTINMSLILLSGTVIPPPAGADVTTQEGLLAAMHLFEPKHFVFPFLAHAVGTLIAAFVAVKMAASQHFKLALLIGCLFLIGGVINASVLPAPLWFESLDLVVAYLPMAWLGYKLAKG